MRERSGAHLLSMERYSLRALRTIADSAPRLELAPDVRERIRRGEEFVARRVSSSEHIYGVNSGFGALCETRVTDEQLELLQYNHVVSHACGVGEPVSERVSRLTLLNKLLTFRYGHCGVSLSTVDRLIEFWNRGAIPVIPKRGTVGASGDLSPLAHLALPLLGHGQVYLEGKIVSGAEALERLGLSPLKLRPKDGLALTNGVQYISAIGVDCVTDFEDMIAGADLITALSAQAFSTSKTFYDPLYQQTSLHLERRTVAENLTRLLSGSNHHALPTCNKSKQDPYSFRCVPQVHGAIRQVYEFASKTLENECNGVSDNPLFFPEQDTILMGGALHGESVAFALDFLAIAASELSSISERRTYQLLSGQRGLPSFLIQSPGVNSGLMIPQYTSAALVNENKVLCTPASVDTIPTCQLQEDHVSMGGTSAYKLQQVLRNAEYVLGIELLTAAQAIDLASELALSPKTRAVHEDFRRRVPFLAVDQPMSGLLEQAREYVCEQRASWRREHDL
jgi:histidine ammonia-lyase